ncbi:MAG: hypothetical protein SXV54_20625 [Chloroflexota bacterium]|nr:hypothetical protein [Chloroflexota bacterium]
MQNVEIVVSQEILAALRLLEWRIEESLEREEDACGRELCLETPAVSLEVALWRGRSAPIQWRLTAPRVDRPGWETLVGHLVAASEYCVEDVTIIYEDERETALLPSDAFWSYVLTITAGDLQLEAVRVEILDADLTSSETEAYLQALAVLEASGQCPELGEGAASCRVCDVPLPPGTAGDHSDTCAGCRGTTHGIRLVDPSDGGSQNEARGCPDH